MAISEDILGQVESSYKLFQILLENQRLATKVQKAREAKLDLRMEEMSQHLIILRERITEVRMGMREGFTDLIHQKTSQIAQSEARAEEICQSVKDIQELLNHLNRRIDP